MPGKILTYIRSITVVFLLTVAAFSAKVYSTDIIPAAKQADSLGLTTDILKIESGDYSGRDKEGLICFLRQESATAGTMNFEKLGLTESDTLAWDTDESWIGELTSSGFLTWDEGTTPYKLQDIIFTGKELGGHLDASFFQALTRLFVGDNALRRLSVSNPNLYTLYCGSNKLSSLDLSECAALEVIDCSGNQLIELKLHPDNYIYNLNCINNRLRFSSLPKLVRQPNYKYSPQAAIDGGELPPRKIIGFDKEYEVVNNGSTYTTSFTWTATPSSPVLTDLTKGLFRTEISNIGQSFVCELKNSYFPDLTLTYSVKVVERETPYYIYNEGVLSLTDKMPDNTLLYVGGDLYAGTDIVSGSNPAEVRNTSEIITEKSRTVLTGNFYNNVKSGTVFDGSKRIAGDPSIFEFRGDEAQTITTKGNSYAAIPSKKTNYIDFPNVRINNNKHVTLDASLAAKTQNIGLDKGWLILDSRKVDGRDYPTSLPNDRSVMAHLLVDGSVDYGDWTGKEPEDRGFIQVNLALDNDEMQGETDPKYDNRKYRSLVGLGTPFHNMKADYFMFNFLMAPTNVSFLGDNKSTIVDPNYTLEAGRGYGLGIDLRGTDASQYTDIAWAGIDFGQRSSGMHYFNRHKFANDPGRSANQIFGTNLSDSAYAEEKLTTENVSVKLNKKRISLSCQSVYVPP
ncbi:MAG: hypothetical protein ACLVKO_03740 [Dysgonomonas sp.]